MTSQIRSEINQILIKLPDNKLITILEYLREVEKATKDQIETAHLVNKIFEQDKELLKALAK